MFILIDSSGGVFYLQERVGKGGKPFNLYKFRTMRPDSDKKGLLTVGSKDNRITKVGYTLRKLKLDELPQLLNVLIGDMSFVGPRPEVKKYVDLYTPEQAEILKVQPGITDYASIEYFSESDLLAQSGNPEETYVKEIMPAKIALNKQYLENPGIRTDVSIILKTLGKIIS